MNTLDFATTEHQGSDQTDNISNIANYPLRMVILDQPKCIQIGRFYCCFPDLFRYPESKASRKSLILKVNERSIKHYVSKKHKDGKLEIVNEVKHYHREYAEHLGCQFNARFQKLSYAIWVGDDAPLIHRYCHDGKSLSAGLVYRFHRFRTIIFKAIGNEEHNLIPAILFFGKELFEIKEIVGSFNWKLICKNSLSRNSLIFNLLYFSSDCCQNKGIAPYANTLKRKPKIINPDVNIIKPIVERLLKLPSSILKMSLLRSVLKNKSRHAHHEMLDIFISISLEATRMKKLTDTTFIDDGFTMYRDSMRMAEHLEVAFRYDWSYKRVAREHNKLTLNYQKIVYADFYDTYIFKYPWSDFLHFEGINVSLLKSGFELAKEGSDMNHCVASYHNDVFYGKSVIFSLTDEAGERSTLELSYQNKSLSVAQHRSQYNGPVSEKFSRVASLVFEEQMRILTRCQNMA